MASKKAGDQASDRDCHVCLIHLLHINLVLKWTLDAQSPSNHSLLTSFLHPRPSMLLTTKSIYPPNCIVRPSPLLHLALQLPKEYLPEDSPTQARGYPLIDVNINSLSSYSEII